MTSFSRRPLGIAIAGLLLAMSLSAPLAAQIDPVEDDGFVGQPVSQGTAYFVFAEPGAPTVEVIVLGSGLRNGIYRLQRGVSFVQALALMGGTARSDSTDRIITTAEIRVLRDQGAGLQPVYVSRTDEFLSDVSRHPTFMTGDIIESVIDSEVVKPPFKLLDALQVASRVASLVSAAILLYYRLSL